MTKSHEIQPDPRHLSPQALEALWKKIEKHLSLPTQNSSELSFGHGQASEKTPISRVVLGVYTAENKPVRVRVGDSIEELMLPLQFYLDYKKSGDKNKYLYLYVPNLRGERTYLKITLIDSGEKKFKSESISGKSLADHHIDLKSIFTLENVRDAYRDILP